MSTGICPFLMFQGGRAEEAMRFYVDLFGGEIIELVRRGPDAPGAEDWILKARFSIAGQVVMCSDSTIEHGFTFTPSSSLFVTCESEDEIRRLAGALLEGRDALMPLGDYGFGRLFAWVADRFGVSWQLILE